jgi:hypothetical protein
MEMKSATKSPTLQTTTWSSREILQWMEACHCVMTTTIKENSGQSSVITQQGQNLKLKGCYCFLQKKKWGC